MSSGLFALVLVTAIGCAIVGGIFYAFSTFVMQGLARLPAPQGIAAMQSINVTVISPLFMLAFLGTAVASIAVAIVAAVQWDESYAVYLLIGSALYLLGPILTTFACNEPRNKALATVDAADPEAAAFWARYVTVWNAWNHVRTIAGLAAAVVMIVGIRVS